MKKNKIILSVSAIMMLGAIAPIYYWYNKSNDRHPASASIEVEHNQETGVRVYAIPDSKEIITTKLPPLEEKLPEGVQTFAIPEPEGEIIVTKLPPIELKKDLVLCEKDDSEDLDVKVKSLIKDKEDLLKEIAELKKPAAKSEKKEEAVLAKVKVKDEDKVDMMAQLTSLMLSQQAQQTMMMQMMMQMMEMQSQKQPESLFSPYGLSLDQYQSHARLNSQAPVYNFYNSSVNMGQGQLPAYESGLLSPYSMFSGGGIGIGYGHGSFGGIGMTAPMGMGSFEEQSHVQHPAQYGFPMEQAQQAPAAQSYHVSQFDRVAF